MTDQQPPDDFTIALFAALAEGAAVGISDLEDAGIYMGQDHEHDGVVCEQE